MEVPLATGPRQAGGELGTTRSTSSGRAARASAIPWARFSAWLECVCVVTFDLELGQALEVSRPAGRPSKTVRVPRLPRPEPLQTPLLSGRPSPHAPPFPRLHPCGSFPPSQVSTLRAHPPGSRSPALLACSLPAWSTVLLGVSLNTLYPQAHLSPTSFD